MTQIPRASVGSAQLQRDAVSTSKVRNGSLLANDFKPGQLPRGSRGRRGAPGVTGAGGLQGPMGPQGPIGPSEAYTASDANGGSLTTTPTSKVQLTLPPGQYVLLGFVTAVKLSAQNATVECGFELGAGFTPVASPAKARVGEGPGGSSLAQIATEEEFDSRFIGTRTVKLVCKSDAASDTSSAQQWRLVAIRVSDLRL